MYKINPPILNRRLTKNDPVNLEFNKGISQIKRYKIKIRKKIIYFVDLTYYNKYVFIKFFPKKLEASPDKYKMIGLGLRLFEVRGIIDTCSEIIKLEMKANENYHYALIGQPYSRDNDLKKFHSVRFSIYKKQATTLFKSDKVTHLPFEMFNFYAVSLKSEKDMLEDLRLLSSEVDIKQFLEECLTNQGREKLNELGIQEN